MAMKTIWIGCLVLCLGVIVCSSVAYAEPVPEYNKILQIQLKYQDNGYSVSSLEVKYGNAPNLKIGSGSLTAKILGNDGKELQSFAVQEPGRAQGDSLGEGGELIGYTEQSVYGDLFITAPYEQGMKQFTLANSRDGTLLVTADITPAVASFCTDYPGDPDCLARTVPVKTATPDTPLVLVLATLFSASVFIAAGLVIMTIRRRTAGIQVPEAEQAPVKKTILVVDDEPDIVNLVHLFLDTKGYVTLTARSGRECIDLLKDHVPDLILLDVGMAPMDGWQTLEELKKNSNTKSIPVLMLTGHKITAMAARQYKICIDDYIMKPFHLNDLGAAIDNTLERKEKLKESLVMAKKAGVDKEKFCELAKLSRIISVNKRIVDIMQVPQAVPALADLDVLDEMSVVDYINVKTKDHEKRVQQLRFEINTSFRSKGLPDLTW